MLIGVIAAVTIVLGGAEDSYPYCGAAADTEVAQVARSGLRPTELVVAASDRGLRRLARSRVLRRVKRLVVCGDDEGIAALVRSRHLRRVEELTVIADGGVLDATTITAIVSSRRLRRTLRVLELAAGDSEAQRTIDADGVTALVDDFDLRELRELVLTWNPISEDGVIAILRAPWAAQLERLGLCETALGPSVTDALVEEHDRLDRLVDLCISYGVGGGSGGTEDYRRLERAYGAVFRHNWDELPSRP